ncbi:4-hydroxythreonine-4-phosphate dehydrogenase PdxA [Altererythrobacter sp. CAU 1778]
MTPLALSLGDPAGIGPELIVEAWARRSQFPAPFVVAGSADVLRGAALARGHSLKVQPIADPLDAARVFEGAIPVIGDSAGTYTPRRPDEAGARLAMNSLELATTLALRGAVGGVVTAPIAKGELAKVGFAFPGQTEFLADACGVAEDDSVMMLAGPSLRTIPVTIHCALAEVPARLSTELIVRRAQVAAAALQRDFGIETPRLAICGLNPHAGENGRMGDEEARIIAPAVQQLQDECIAATGPHPADTIFAPHARATYDVALAMYHDQALVPIKALDFDLGVNVTLGLPIVRTSPDHGTAFDIAGTATARPDSFIAAIRMAAEMAANRAHG